MTEADLQAAVIDLAQVYRWHVMHIRPAQNSRGDWRTPIAADGKGYPDLTMVRGTELMFVELKSAKGRLTAEQELWLVKLGDTCADVYVWKPADWLDGSIEERLAWVR